MLYKVAVTETRRRIVSVEANSAQAAHRRVADAWQNCEVMLDNEDFDGVEFHVDGEIENNNGLFKIERKD